MSTSSERSGMVATRDGHRVTPAELFFDLVFVYAITQVTALMAAHVSVGRVLGALVVLALLWWCWCCFAWLGNVVRADTGALFAVLVTVMAVVQIVSLVVPGVFTHADGGLPAPLTFVLCYGAVRLLHLAAYRVAHPDDRALHRTLRRTALLSVGPPFVLLLAGSFLSGAVQVLVWLCAVLVDYAGIYLTGGSGWRVVSPGHFAERHGLIVIIALGESIVAIGVGVGDFAVTLPVLGAATAGLLAAAALWRVYFRHVMPEAEHRITGLDGDARTRFARDVYTFLHLPLVAGVVLTALGIKKALHQVADNDHYPLTEPVHGLAAWALTGGAGLFLLGAAAILLRTVPARRPFALLAVGVACLAAGAVVQLVPALLALVLLAAALTAVALRSAPARADDDSQQDAP
ncbi:low temperature requirement protein A [Streptomyces oryzae]|uniref:Low temperature requirement protein A n=1 Tax=Streptomyces oryzae TaxID=1434886 RepID=A0ABS3XDP7_9ACTN|nr:low temperature requirement protein A [Streptomyces oryzae]MBO8193206.1 low temperature requirement protein A [Streptomyces oryzae]